MRSVLTLPFSSMTHVGNDINVMQWKNARNLTRRPSIRVSGKKKPFCKYAKVQNGGLHKWHEWCHKLILRKNAPTFLSPIQLSIGVVQLHLSIGITSGDSLSMSSNSHTIQPGQTPNNNPPWSYLIALLVNMNSHVPNLVFHSSSSIQGVPASL